MKFDINKEELFVYIIIIIIFLAVFCRLSIGLNIVLGLFLAIILIIYLQTKKNEESNITEEHKETKIKTIKPSTINHLKKYSELIDFLFSIQEFYSFNPPNYEDMVDSLEDFLIIYEEVMVDKQLAGINYSLAEQKRSDALNALHSIILRSPVVRHKYYNDKLSLARERLDFILSAYLDNIIEINKKNIVEFGYNNKTVIIDEYPKASNYYSECGSDKYTYEIY